MQPVGIAAADHQTAGEFVDDDNFSVVDDVIVIPFENVVRFERLLDMVVQIGVFDIRKVGEPEETLRLCRTAFGDLHALFLHVDGEIFFGHERLHKTVGGNVFFARFLSSARNDERRSRFIDQNGVHFVDDGEHQIALHHLIHAAF